MNYAYQYFKLISNRVQHQLSKDDCYVECHHVIPKSEGGKDTPDNLVNLTAREHYIAHLLLVKIYDDFKMHCALIYMKRTNGVRLKKFNSKLYQKLREKCSALRSEHNKKCFTNRHWFNDGTRQVLCCECPSGFKKGMIPGSNNRRTLSDETRTKISAAKKGKKLSDEHRAKLIASHKGKPSGMKGRHLSAETRAKMSAAKKGKVVSDETKHKMSESRRRYSQYKIEFQNGDTQIFNSVYEAAAAAGCTTVWFYVCAKNKRLCNNMKFEVM